MKIPYNDLRFVTACFYDQIKMAVKRIADRGIFLNGPEVERFEALWAEYCNANFCISCASGTDALMLAAQFLGEIYKKFKIPANTTPFTRRGISRSTDVEIVDVSPADGWPLKFDHMVVPVMLHGRDLPKGTITSCLIDACQAHGCFRHERLPGMPSELSIQAAAWSFYPTKNLGAWGDAGAVTCDNPILALKIQTMRNAWHSRMSEVDAAVCRIKLQRLDEMNAVRWDLASVYWNELPKEVAVVTRPEDRSNLHIFAVLVERERRSALIKYLIEREIGTKIHYPEPLEDLPGATSWCNSILSLPLYPGLTEMSIREVCDAIKGFFK